MVLLGRALYGIVFYGALEKEVFDFPSGTKSLIKVIFTILCAQVNKLLGMWSDRSGTGATVEAMVRPWSGHGQRSVEG